MLLAIDVGNTNTVFALCQSQGDAEARIVAEWRIVTDGRRTADQYFVWLSQLMRHHWIDADDVSAILIASVAPETLFNLHTLAERYFNTRAMVIGDPGLDLGIAVKTDRPAEVGADRVVNALAAHQSYGPDLIVLDFGTATTFDIVDETGAYAGGVIAPGVNLSAEALYRAASKLPRIAITRPARVVGADTTPAMQSGMYWGYVGLIEGICRRIVAERGRPMTTIATGGLSSLFAEGTDAIDHVDQGLTLRGLIEIHRRNVGRKTDAQP